MRYRPVAPAELPAILVAGLPSTRCRVAIDGALSTDPHALGAAMVGALHAAGRPAVQVRAETFWRDASVRLEYGHTDLHAYVHDWLDLAALRRELLDPLGPGGSGLYLPSLRDPQTNRATREPTRAAEVELVAVLSGELLLAHRLPFDHAVHLEASVAALRRRTAPERAWTLAAFADYAPRADVIVKVEDPRHPAIASPDGFDR